MLKMFKCAKSFKHGQLQNMCMESRATSGYDMNHANARGSKAYPPGKF